MSEPWGVYDPDLRYLRQSTISTGDICLQRMGYDLDPNVKRGTGEARIVGTAYHAGLECYYRSRLETGFGAPIQTALAMAEAAFDAELATSPDLVWATSESDARARVAQMLHQYFSGASGSSPCVWNDDWQVIGVEQEWFLPMPYRPGWGLKGTIDLIVWHPERGLVIVDHKTAGRKWPKAKEAPHKNVQVPMYWWAAKQYDLEPKAFTFDVMTYKGEFERRWVSVTHAQEAALLRKAGAYASLIEADLPELPTNPASNLCSPLYCDHWERCPNGAISAEVSA